MRDRAQMPNPQASKLAPWYDDVAHSAITTFLGRLALITPGVQKNDATEKPIRFYQKGGASSLRVRARVPKRFQHSENFDYIGEREVWGAYRSFGVSAESRKQHLHCI